MSKLDKILKNFRKTITQLENVIDHHASQIAFNNEQIKGLREENAWRSDEAQKAEKISNRLTNLITGE
jgi:hypothetical protein